VTSDTQLPEALERALQQPDSWRESSAEPAVLELTALVHLARSLEASAAAVKPTAEFRSAARERLLVQLTRTPKRSAQPVTRARPSLRARLACWGMRLGVGLTTVSVFGAAAASASANALPGDPLYPIKQAGEVLAVQLAPDDAARQQVWLNQADTRLDETARLLEQGRDTEASASIGQYDAALDAAAVDDPATAALQPRLEEKQARLSALLKTAPVSARPGLQRALEATQRGQTRGNGAHAAETASVAPESDPTPAPAETTRTRREPAPVRVQSAPASIDPTRTAVEVGGTSQQPPDDTDSGVQDEAPAVASQVTRPIPKPNNQSTTERNPAANARPPAGSAAVPDRGAHRGRP
jgi:uncharacterized protein DUF5667